MQDGGRHCGENFFNLLKTPRGISHLQILKSREKKKENGVSTLLTKILFFFRDHRRIGCFKIGEVGIITFPPVAPGGKREKKFLFLETVRVALQSTTCFWLSRGRPKKKTRPPVTKTYNHSTILFEDRGGPLKTDCSPCLPGGKNATGLSDWRRLFRENTDSFRMSVSLSLSDIAVSANVVVFPFRYYPTTVAEHVRSSADEEKAPQQHPTAV